MTVYYHIDDFPNAEARLEAHSRAAQSPAAYRVPHAAEPLEINGETRTVGEWLKLAGLSRNILRARIREQGWDLIPAVTVPLPTMKRRKKV